MRMVQLSNVTLDLPIYSVSARSLRRAVVNLAVGSRILRSRQDRIVVRALDGISLNLEEGDRLGIIGPNGSGKSTLLRTLAGIYHPTSGSVVVKGEVSSVFDTTTGLDVEASGEENIILLARYRGHTRKEVEAAMESIADFSELGAFLQLPVKTYSAGMLARLAFGVATSFQPDILVMDEWIAAGDARFHVKAQARLEQIVERTRVMVLASHNTHIVSQFCNKVAIMDAGRVVALGPSAEVLAQLAA